MTPQEILNLTYKSRWELYSDFAAAVSAMQQYAKQEVAKALQAAAAKAQILDRNEEVYSGDSYSVDANSILTAYKVPKLK